MVFGPGLGYSWHIAFIFLDHVAVFFLQSIFPWDKEETVSAIFRLHNFYYPVELTTEQTSPLTGLTWLKPSNFIRAMARNNDLSHLLGGGKLEESKEKLLHFWGVYKTLFPEHQLWSEQKPLEKCIPLFLHGDEGIHYRKSGLLVVSFQGIIGSGCSKRASDLEKKHGAAGKNIPINYLRTGFQTRMLILVCPKDWLVTNSCMNVLKVCNFIYMHVHVYSIPFFVWTDASSYFIHRPCQGPLQRGSENMECHVWNHCGRPSCLPTGWDRLWWQYWKNISHCFGQQRWLELLSPLVYIYWTFFYLNLHRWFWGLVFFNITIQHFAVCSSIHFWESDTCFLLLYVVNQQVRYPALISRDLTGVHQRGQEIPTRLEQGFVTFAWLATE